jgi:hypothetical protein
MSDACTNGYKTKMQQQRESSAEQEMEQQLNGH